MILAESLLAVSREVAFRKSNLIIAGKRKGGLRLSDKLILCIDDHEDPQTIAHCRLVLNQDFEIKVGRYDVSDYHIGQKLGIEHKTPEDFRASVFDGRLSAQAHELKQFEIPCVVVSGTLDEILYDRRGGFDPASMWGACASLLVSHRVPVWFVGERGLPYAIQFLAKRAINGKVSEYTPVRRDPTTKEVGVAVLSALPGIGPEKAKQVLKYFGGLGEALSNTERWTEVPGIGPKIRDSILKAMKERVE